MNHTFAFNLDHVVVNVHFDVDRAQAIFSALGFTLTPRGRHSLGSINHLIVLEEDYVEIVGLPSDTDILRQEVLDSPVGIDGLVFQTQRADQTYQALVDTKHAVLPVQGFTRPVEYKGVMSTAQFRTTRLKPGTFGAGRVYFCQHLTPELVWQKDWQSHLNKTIRIAAVLIVSPQPAAEAKKYLTAAGGILKKGLFGEWRIQADKHVLVFMTVFQYEQCYGKRVNVQNCRTNFFGAMALQTTDLDAVKQCLLDAKQRFPGIRWHADPNRISVSIPAFNTVIDFIH